MNDINITTDPDPLSGSVVRLDQLLQETSGADLWNQSWNDFIGPFHWFPVQTDRIVRLGQKVDQGLTQSSGFELNIHQLVLHTLTSNYVSAGSALE